MNAILQTASGRPFDLLNPSADQIEWRVVANALSRICRFGGHLPEDIDNYSVAQHCCLAADLVSPAYRLAVLLHDAHEAFTNDLIRPYQHAIQAVDGNSQAHKHIAAAVQAAIHDAAKIPHSLSDATQKAIHLADQIMLATERRYLLAESPMQWEKLPPPLPLPIKPWNRIRAADEFLSRLDRWLPLAQHTQ